MKITKIETWNLTLPLVRPYYLSGGRLRFEKLESVILRISTDEGIEGWGEGCPWGESYLPAHGTGIVPALQIIAPALLELDPLAIQSLNALMDERLPGHLYAKSPLDMALWDILGKKAGMPLWQLFGASKPKSVALNSSISTGSPQDMVAAIQGSHQKGYRTHSAKIGGQDVRADIERIRIIEANLPNGDQITFDVNRAWLPATALQVLGSVESRAWVEQPCETLDMCAAVASKVSQPILLDECLHSVEDHLRALKLGVFSGLKIKPNRVGGLSKARFLRDLSVHAGWRMHIEDVGGTALADTAAFHLAASTPDEFRMASWLAHAHLKDDPMKGQGVRNNHGLAELGYKPGIGLTPDPEHLGQVSQIFSI